ncbi:PTS sugar transporter subunit IIB [Enterococcus cecorum]|nr:PTS sugar transporter subunit IIB [Enterococcus cecorum]CAI3317768.1 PTS sugar transporter subunit IIB [Enterococcus cecorum]
MSLKLHKPSDVKLNLIADSNLEYFLKKICFIDENLMLIFDDAVTMSRIIKEMNYKEKVFINDFLLTNKTINPYYSNSEIIDAIKTLLENNNNVIFKKNIYSSEVNVARYLCEGVK